MLQAVTDAEAASLISHEESWSVCFLQAIKHVCTVKMNVQSLIESLISLLRLTVPSLPLAVELQTQSALVAVGVVGREQASLKLA